MTTQWSEYLPYVLPYCPGMPPMIAERYVRDAAIEFCDRSGYWQEDLADFNTVVGQTEYDLLTSPVTFHIAAILEVKVGGLNIYPGAYTFDEETLTLEVEPTAVRTVEIKVAKKPTPASVEGPSVLFNSFREAIAAGALARALVVPGATWSDPAAAMFHQLEFDGGIGRARLKKEVQATRHSLRVRLRNWI
jgi:hypothetical protein